MVNALCYENRLGQRSKVKRKQIVDNITVEKVVTKKGDRKFIFKKKIKL